MRLLCLVLIAFLSVACSKKPKPDDKVVEENGPSAQEYFVKGNTFLDKGKWDKAIAEYNKAAEIAENRWDIYVNRGVAQSQKGEFNAAINSFDEAFKAGGTEEPSVYYNLGNVYHEQGLYSQAIDVYRSGLAYGEKPDVDMLTNLGASYLFLHRYAEAEETYAHIRTLAPDDPRALHGSGMVKLVQGQIEDAINIFEQVTSSFPDYGLSFYALGICHARKNQHQKAIDAWNGFLQTNPDSRYRKRIESRIGMQKSKLQQK